MSKRAVRGRAFSAWLKLSGVVLLLFYAAFLYFAFSFSGGDVTSAKESWSKNTPPTVLRVAVGICSGLEICETGAFLALVCIYM